MFLHQSSMTFQELMYFNQVQPEHRLSVLLTIADLPRNVAQFTNTRRHMIRSLALDSGAFSVNTGRKGLTEESLFKKFVNYTKVAGDAYDLVFNYDIDFSGTQGGFDHNNEYLTDMKREGLNPIPVVHNLYSGEIEFFIREGYEIVAIGQCRDGRRFKDIESAVFRLYDAGVKVHLFGISEFDFLAKLPIWSCDSSSWVQYVRYGQVVFWNPEKVGFDKTDRIYFPKYQVEPDPAMGHYYARYPDLDIFAEHIVRKLNITINHLFGLNDQFYQKMVNILYFAELERIVTAIHQKKGFTFDKP